MAELEALSLADAEAVRARGFPVRVSERLLLLTLLDLLAINLALLLSVGIRPDYDLSWRLPAERPEWFVYASLLWYLVAQVFDAYDLRRSARIGAVAQAVLKAGLVTTLVYLLTPYLTPTLPPSRRYLLPFPVLAPGLLLAGRCLYLLTLARGFFQARVLILGTGSAGLAALEALTEQGAGTYHVVGFVDDDEAQIGRSYAVAPPEDVPAHGGTRTVRVLGGRADLQDVVGRYRVGTLVLAIPAEIGDELLEKLMECLQQGVEIVPMSDLYEQLTGRVPVEHIGARWHVSLPIRQAGNAWPRLKRGLDLGLAILGLIVLTALLPFVALAIRIDSPGPVFYTQQRVGKGGLRFRIYKFRTMIPNAEKSEAVWAHEKDPRVTRVGRVLRKLHLDELPQLLNVFHGDMSLVGPRPERPELVEGLAERIPFYDVRHAVRPGMAGWGVVRQGYAATDRDTLVKLGYDLYYIKHQSLWLDLVILMKTMLRVLALSGR